MPPTDPDDPTPPADWTARAAQVLPTEHFTLQSARGATIADANGRAAMYLGALASTLVALGFVGQTSDLGTAFFVFALVLLPTLFFLGLTTVVRVTQSSAEDILYAQGINRIRHFYLDYVPEAAPFFILSAHDDMAGVMHNMGVKNPGRRQIFLTMAGTLGIVNSVVGGACVGIAVSLLDPPLGVAVAAGALACGAAVFGHLRLEEAIFDEGVAVEPRFPTAPGAARPTG